MQRLFTRGAQSIRSLPRIATNAPAKYSANAFRSMATLFGKPHESNPIWVDYRGLSAIQELHQLDDRFFDALPESFVLVDAGCGRGKLLAQIKQQYPFAKVIGATATAIDQENERAIDAIYYGLLPNARKLFKHHAGKADIVLDTMGAIAYGDNPVHMVIALCSLLKKGAKLSSVSIGNEQHSRFGDAKTRDKLKAFLSDELGMSIAFSFYQNAMLVRPTTQPTLTISSIVAFKEGASIIKDMDAIFKMADQIVGIPKTIDNQNCLFRFPNHFPTKGFGPISYVTDPNYKLENTAANHHTLKSRL